MPYCPKCREEYREDFDTCADCNAKLVSELEPLPEETDTEEEMLGMNIEAYDDLSLLMNVADDIEANIIKAFLEAEGIPVLKREKEIGNVYMGIAKTGVDLFVPASQLDIVREIINSQPDVAPGSIEEEDSENGDYEIDGQEESEQVETPEQNDEPDNTELFNGQEYEKKRKVLIILMLIVLIIMAGLYYLNR